MATRVVLFPESLGAGPANGLVALVTGPAVVKSAVCRSATHRISILNPAYFFPPIVLDWQPMIPDGTALLVTAPGRA